MNIVLLFNKQLWTHTQVSQFLKGKHVPCRLRIGFTNYVAVAEVEQIDLTTLKGKGLGKLTAVAFEKQADVGNGSRSDIALPNAYVIDNETITECPLENLLLEKDENLAFDLQNFGFDPKPSAELWEIYDDVAASLRNCVRPEAHRMVVDSCDCGDLIRDEAISLAIRKLLLDFYTLRAASICVGANLVLARPKYPGKNNLTYYSKLLMTGTTTRAMYDRLMTLAATMDDELDEGRLSSNRSTKRAFLKQSATSSFPPTQMTREAVESLWILDDKYRSPELHKTGRLYSLVHAGHVDSLMNELCSFQNQATDLFNRFCAHLREIGT